MPKTGLTPQEIRKKALLAAEKLICRHGADRLKMTDVAREIKVSHAALYNYFPDRDALQDAVSKLWLDRLDGELAKIATGRLGAGERILQWFLALHRMKREKVLKESALFDSFEISAHRKSEVIAAHLKNSRGQLTDMVGAALESGEIREGDPAAIAGLLFESTLAFHHPRFVLEHASKNREKDLKDLIQVLLAGLKGNGGGAHPAG